MTLPTYNTPPTISYEEAVPLLARGDLVFYRERRNAGRLYDVCKTLFSDKPYVEVSLLDGSSPQPHVMTLQGQDIKWVPLQVIAEKRPVDIFRLNNQTHTRLWLEENLINQRTFTIDFLHVQLRLLLYLRKKPLAGITCWRFHRSYDNDEALLRNVTQAACIEAAFSDAGFDLCPRVSPNNATPARLSKSALLEHLFSID